MHANLRPIYDETDGVDGFVSVEVSPTLTDDTKGTVKATAPCIASIKKLFHRACWSM